MRCRHEGVRGDAKPRPNGDGYIYDGSYICPDCDRPVEVTSNYAERPEGCKPSFRVATWSMAGVGNYWKKL